MNTYSLNDGWKQLEFLRAIYNIKLFYFRMPLRKTETKHLTYYILLELIP